MNNKRQYDSIDNIYERFNQCSPSRKIEIRTIMKLVGDMKGKSVLDLACGYGFYSRAAYHLGASKVVGIDISRKMIELAKNKSKQNNEKITFHIGDAATLGSVGKFDIIIASWLFNYSDSLTGLENMFKTIVCNLNNKGRLVACTTNPEFRLSRGNCQQYGITIFKEESWKEGSRYQAEFITNTDSSFSFYRWAKKDYERIIKNLDCLTFSWQQPILLESDIKKYPPGFWNNFQNNNLPIFLMCKQCQH